MSDFFFSIIIPALNEKRDLPLLLNDLANQSEMNFEIIVVDGGSTDGTTDKCLEFIGQAKIQIVTSLVQNVSIQRNIGASLANSKWILFMDADNRIGPKFLEELRSSLRSKKIDVFTTWIDPTAYTETYQPLIILCNIWMEIFVHIKPFMPGALIGIRRTVWNSVEFDPSLSISEDHEFARTAKDLGFRLHVFHTPRYVYNLRRLETEGLGKFSQTFSKVLINEVVGSTIFDTSHDYPMIGGTYHTHITSKNSLLYWYKDYAKFTETIPKLVQKRAVRFFNELMNV